MADPADVTALGVGVSSAATVEEVSSLVDVVLAEAGVGREEVSVVATVDHRAGHPAVLGLGLPLVAYARAELGDAVAEPAATRAAGRRAELLVRKTRSAHATAAVARGRGRALEPAGHGGDGARLAEVLGLAPDQVLDLSQSLNPVAPDVAPLVARHADAVTRYPDVAAATRALAAAVGVEPERLVLTNGGSEAIALVAVELGRGWVDEPDFSLYRRHLPVLDTDGPRFRSNPHSPSGRLATDAEHADVWDEAFHPLATGRWTAGRGGIVVGSLTKTFACPGLRLGYVLAPDDGFAARIRARQPAWSVGSLALAVLPELLAAAELEKWSAAIGLLRRELLDVLAGHGLAATDTDANWVLVADRDLRDDLAEHGVLVRDCATFGLPGTMRVAVPDADGLARLDRALSRRS